MIRHKTVIKYRKLIVFAVAFAVYLNMMTINMGSFTAEGKIETADEDEEAFSIELSNPSESLGDVEDVELSKWVKSKFMEVELEDRIDLDIKKKPYRSIHELDIRTPSNWTMLDFKASVNDELLPVAEAAIKIEEAAGVNAVYLVAVAATETLWGKKLPGSYNYFSWSTDGKYYYNFDSLDKFCEYSSKRYNDSFCNPDFYGTDLGKITIDIVNTRYAKYEDGSVNYDWAIVVKDITNKIYKAHEEAVMAA